MFSFILLLACRGVDSFGSPLGDVAGTVEFGALTAVPKTVQRNAFTGQGGGCQLFWNYGVSATDSGESGCLREAAELLSGTFLGTFYFVKWSGGTSSS